jgi:hypothetical protein
MDGWMDGWIDRSIDRSNNRHGSRFWRLNAFSSTLSHNAAASWCYLYTLLWYERCQVSQDMEKAAVASFMPHPTPSKPKTTTFLFSDVCLEINWESAYWVIYIIESREVLFAGICSTTKTSADLSVPPFSVHGILSRSCHCSETHNLFDVTLVFACSVRWSLPRDQDVACSLLQLLSCRTTSCQ